MAGISGIICFDNTPPPRAQLAAMTGISRYRGADDSCWTDDHAAFLVQNLAHSRSVGEREAGIFHDQQSGLTIAADVRLDEAQDLARRLAIGDWRSTTAPELLVRAYQRWGRSSLDHFAGDFALIIWDPRLRSVFCARDHFGVASLYWAWAGASLYCASDMQQLLACPQIDAEIDDLAVADLLLTRYRYHERTIIRGIRRLPHGHCLAASENRRCVSRYWQPGDHRKLTYRDDEAYAEHFAEIFAQAVKNRIASCDDTVGLLMSGGLDSCSIAAQAQQQLHRQGRKLRVRSAVFEQHPHCDERQFIAAMERHCALDIDYVRGEDFPWFDPPLSHTPSIEIPFHPWEPYFRHVFSRFRDDRTHIVLTGIGGDTLLTGSLLVYLDSLLSGNFSALSDLKTSARQRRIPLRRLFYRSILKPLFPAYLKPIVRAMRAALGKEIPSWISPSFAARIDLRDILYPAADPARHSQRSRQAILAEILEPGIEPGLRAIDHYAGRQGLELRHPFLDRRLAEFVAAIPPEQLLAKGLTKDILRRAMCGSLPNAVRDRPDKTYLTSFIHTNFGRTLKGDIIELFKNSHLQELGFIDAKVLQTVYDDYCRGRTSLDGSALSAVLSLETWFCAYRRFTRRRAETAAVTDDEHLQYNVSR
jgi:asparagine synthase (glutamine-hydrolysing)